VKILNSDQAWDVYENLLSDYFSMRDQQKNIVGKTAATHTGMTDYQQQSIRIQKAKLLNQIAAEYEGTYRQILHSYATKELTAAAVGGKDLQRNRDRGNVGYLRE
jgi:hypothetical protein